MDTENFTKEELAKSNLRDHMANERTFLAWVRTCIGIMAFGFVVEKFSLFLKQIASYFEKESLHAAYIPHLIQSSSAIFGVVLVALGTLICLMAFISYKKTEDQINNDSYSPNHMLDLLLTIAIILMGIFLTIYLISSA